MYPTLAILVLSLLKCAVATVNTSTECVASSSYLAIRKLLQEELQGTTADTGLHLKLDNTLGTDGSLLSAIRSPVSFKGFSPHLKFRVTKDTRLSVSFRIDNGIDNTKLQKAELWLFPETQQNATNSLVDLHFQVSAEAANLSRQMRRPGHTWNTSEPCIPLDITSVVKKLFRALRNRGISSVQAVITVSITTIKTPTIRKQLQLSFNRNDDGSRCRILPTGCSQRPFLVLKYSASNRPFVVGGIVRPGSIDDNPTTATKPAEQQNHTTTIGQTTPPPLAPTSSASLQACETLDYTVNLTELQSIGLNILFPREINIRRCSGACSVTNIKKFTTHSSLKRYFNNFSSCCVPTKMSSQKVLLLENDAYILVALRNVIVEDCGCR